MDFSVTKSVVLKRKQISEQCMQCDCNEVKGKVSVCGGVQTAQIWASQTSYPHSSPSPQGLADSIPRKSFFQSCFNSEHCFQVKCFRRKIKLLLLSEFRFFLLLSIMYFLPLQSADGFGFLQCSQGPLCLPSSLPRPMFSSSKSSGFQLLPLSSLLFFFLLAGLHLQTLVWFISSHLSNVTSSKQSFPTTQSKQLMGWQDGLASEDVNCASLINVDLSSFPGT